MYIICYKNVKAKKFYLCSLCSIHVSIGEIHRYAYVDDGGTYECRTHLRCLELASLIANEYNLGDRVSSDEFINYVWDYYRNNCDSYIKGKGKWLDARNFTLSSHGLCAKEMREIKC